MANRIVRNTAILLKEEVTYGVDPTPTGAVNALLVSNLSINPLNAQNVDRNIIRPYLGGSEQLLGTRYVECGFDLELAGAGTVATAPAWAAAVLSCGFAQTLTATIRADYTPVSTAFKSCTIYWYDDGVLHKATGCRGTFTVNMRVGERPVASFRFTGIYSTPTAAANPSVTLTSWKTPMVVTDANTQDTTFGATHSTTLAPAFTGGTVYPSQGIELDVGNSINFTALLGGETVDLTQRSVTGKVTLDLTAAQEVTLTSAVEAGTTQTLGLLHGTVANQKVGLWMPAVQLINVQKADVNGKRMVSFDLRVLPSAGDDELRIITSF
ncbi:MAG: hypothetical protein MUF08_00425 [Burkholderiaceae bacterium]|jgi:hypothetical protein|nr:hypothetical protein [Burkholderiaceae bacterium]